MVTRVLGKRNVPDCGKNPPVLRVQGGRKGHVRNPSFRTGARQSQVPEPARVLRQVWWGSGGVWTFPLCFGGVGRVGRTAGVRGFALVVRERTCARSRSALLHFRAAAFRRKKPVFNRSALRALALRALALVRSLRRRRARIMCEILVVVQRGAGRVHLGEVFEKMIDIAILSARRFGGLGKRRLLAREQPVTLAL